MKFSRPARKMASKMLATTRTTVTLALLFCLHGVVDGSPIFQNTGTVSGWDTTNVEHNGYLGTETNVVYKGTTGIKAQQTYDSSGSYTGRYHSEVIKLGIYQRGGSGFYGFEFRLQSDWEFDEQSYNIGQFIADFSDYGCDDYIPTSMVWIVGNQLYSRVKYGAICPKSAQQITTYPNLATVSAGVWHKVEIQASWQSDTTGYYKLWFDGVKVLEQYNIATTLPDSRPIDFHVGIYANGWHDDGHMVGSQPTRQIWYDQIGVGTAFADADPDQWYIG